LPRLIRDDRHFLPLAPPRPERSSIFGDSGLLGVLTKAFPQQTRASLRARVAAGAEALRPLLRQLGSEAQSRIEAGDPSARPPTLVFAVDQAEELFSAENATEGANLLKIFSELASNDDPAVSFIFAIRSDAYDRLQHAEPLAGLLQQTQSLPPLPRGEYARIIEGPASRVEAAGRKLKIDPRLTQALLEDLEQGRGGDPLPLLAFTLEHLWREYSSAGVITRKDYEATGRMGGVIDRAVTRAFRAADSDPRIPRDASSRAALLRRGFIPWLAGVDPDTRAPRREIARRKDIPEQCRPLIDLLVGERLLRTDTREEVGTDGISRMVATLDPAHEALLRQWRLLRGWLVADYETLATLESVKTASRDWDVKGRTDAWFAHYGRRLADANKLEARKDIAVRLDRVDLDYLLGCRRKENRRRLSYAAMAVASLLTVGTVLGNYAYAEYIRRTALACDLLAAERDNSVGVPGVEFDNIDAKQAIPACESAVRSEPDNPRLQHNLGRAYEAAGRYGDAVDRYSKAAEFGWASSQNNLAVDLILGRGTRTA